MLPSRSSSLTRRNSSNSGAGVTQRSLGRRNSGRSPSRERKTSRQNISNNERRCGISEKDTGGSALSSEHFSVVVSPEQQQYRKRLSQRRDNANKSTSPRSDAGFDISTTNSFSPAFSSKPTRRTSDRDGTEASSSSFFEGASIDPSSPGQNPFLHASRLSFSTPTSLAAQKNPFLNFSSAGPSSVSTPVSIPSPRSTKQPLRRYPSPSRGRSFAVTRATGSLPSPPYKPGTQDASNFSSTSTYASSRRESFRRFATSRSTAFKPGQVPTS